MKYHLSIDPAVVEDAARAQAWYHHFSEALAERFEVSLNDAIAEVSRHPQSFREHARGWRRTLLKTFPYALYFLLEADTIIIAGLFHCARDPEFLRSTLESRREEDSCSTIP